ncbi:MAG: hypothetical protein ACTSU2_03735 [Promethearchaeota archaeon]
MMKINYTNDAYIEILYNPNDDSDSIMINYHFGVFNYNIYIQTLDLLLFGFMNNFEMFFESALKYIRFLGYLIGFLKDKDIFKCQINFHYLNYEEINDPDLSNSNTMVFIEEIDLERVAEIERELYNSFDKQKKNKDKKIKNKKIEFFAVNFC